MSRSTLALALVLQLIPAFASAQDAPRRTVVVGTHPIAPFVVHEPDGSWSGISIELWRRVAAELGYETEIRELPVRELVSGRADVDVVISLVIDADRERTFDMTHAFYLTGLAIAVAPREPSLGDVLLERVLTPDLALAALALVLTMLASGLVMWRLEQRANPDEFGGSAGLLSGLMWSIETVVGYNDPQHKTRLGRAFGILWAMIGVVVVSTLTAQISSQLTVSELESDIRGLEDLDGVAVGTVRDSPSQRFLTARGLSVRRYDTARAAVDALAAGQIRAVVYEAPILTYEVARREGSTLRVLPGTYDNHGYGFGLRSGSSLREEIDRAMLSIVRDEAWQATLASYLDGDR